MALQFNLAADNEINKLGIDLPEAYAVVAGYEGNKEFVTFGLTVCASAAARAALKSPINVLTFRVENAEIDGKEGDTQLARIYNYVKTLPAFEGSTDV
jgi:hypothetical protein